MKFLLSILTGLFSALSLLAAPTLPPAFFARQSVLNTGNWVKIAVDDTGIYEVSYQTLKSMGFTDPEKVGVYGRGGKVIPMDFVDWSGKLNVSDDLEPVAVLHLNDKIYFYAEGVDTQTFNDASALSIKGYYERYSKNIYSHKGYYFLSDVEPPLLMDVRTIEESAANGTTATGYGKISHEVDLIHNMSNTGQLYFGEKLTGDNARIEWPLSLPGCIPYETGVMECSFYLDRDVRGHLSYGVKGMDDNISFDTKTYASTVMRDQEPRYGEVKVTGESTTLFVEFQTSDDVEIAHLDYWTLTYPRYLPTLRDGKGNRLNQEFISFPDIPRNRTWAATFTNAGSMCILDISIPTRPAVLDGELRGSNKTVHITNNTGVAELMVFDPMLPQKQISGYNTANPFMSNQNLHALAADGVDLIIICIPALHDRALRLAAIHEKHEGIKVAVATTEEVYNEFSQGIPDPMAYRSFVKAAYSSEHPVKNLLLLGPLVADVRGTP
ncbi:MAG: hypothetical protein K2M03_08265, partial [Muribaculaceae bacterium]|nr:hypothetical protein [Muribaculaceae bacterium]